MGSDCISSRSLLIFLLNSDLTTHVLKAVSGHRIESGISNSGVCNNLSLNRIVLEYLNVTTNIPFSNNTSFLSKSFLFEKSSLVAGTKSDFLKTEKLQTRINTKTLNL